MKISKVQDPSIEALFEQGAISEEQPLSFAQRGLMGVRMTPEGKASYMKTLPGVSDAGFVDGRPVYMRDGNAFFADPEGFEMGDIADMSGPAMEVIPELGASVFSLNPVAAATGAGVGAYLRRGASELVPGEEGDINMPAYAAQNALIAGTFQGGANALSGLWRAVPKPWLGKPGNAFGSLANRGYDKAMSSSFADESRRLERWMQDVDPEFSFSVGQASGSPTMNMFEGMFRRNPFTSDVVSEFDHRQLVASINKLNQISDDFYSGVTSAATTGDALKKAWNDTAWGFIKKRSADAKRDFASVHHLAGGAKVMPLSSTKNAMQGVVDDFSASFGGNEATRLADYMAKQLENLGDFTTAKDFQNMLDIWGSASRGKGNPFADILADKSKSIEISRRIFNALKDDLDNAEKGMIQAGVEGQRAAKALKQARANWAKNSIGLNQMERSVLAKHFKVPLDQIDETRIMESVLRQKPTELAKTREVLEMIDPDLLQQVKRFYWESIVDSSYATVGAGGAKQFLDLLADFGKTPVSNRKMATNLSKQMDNLSALLTPAEMGEIKNYFQVAARLGDKALEGSPTQPLQATKEVMTNVLSYNPSKWIAQVVRIMGPRRVLDTALNPQGRTALVELSQASSWSRQTMGAASYFVYLLGSEDARTSEGAPPQQNPLQPQMQQ